MGLSPDLEEYMLNMVSYSLGSSQIPSIFLIEQLQLAEERRRGLESQVCRLQNELLDLARRLDLSKEEAAMNARALKLQVSERERLERQAADRCAWLEEEIRLYSKDRDMFMVAADEAEERCAEAQEQKSAALECVEKIQAESRDEIARLSCQVQQLQAENALLQKDLSDFQDTRTRRRSAAEKDHGLQLSSSSSITNATIADVSDREPLKDDGCEDRTREGCPICKQQSEVIPGLMSEIQRLWTEITFYKMNQARAEAQIRILTDENRDLKSSARRNECSTTMSPSPAAKKGKIMMDKSQKRLNYHVRQPLQLLNSNIINQLTDSIE